MLTLSVCIVISLVYYTYSRRFSVLEAKSTYFNDYILLDGDFSIDNVDSIRLDLEVFLPNALETFINDNGIIVISDNIIEHSNYYLNEKINENVRGFYRTYEGAPMIWIDAKVFNYGLFAGNTIFHEMAHYLDDVYKFSSSKELKDYYNKYALDYIPKVSVDEGYQAYNEKEYFACLFTDYTRTYENISMSEDVYIYMSDVFEKIENVNKLKNR